MLKNIFTKIQVFQAAQGANNKCLKKLKKNSVNLFKKQSCFKVFSRFEIYFGGGKMLL